MNAFDAWADAQVHMSGGSCPMQWHVIAHVNNNLKSKLIGIH